MSPSKPQLPARYEYLSTLGEGGTATVYRVRDRLLEVQRALKVVKRADGTDRTERFLSEARAMARLDHPNILRVYDVSIQPKSVAIVMELATGGTLRDLVAGGPMPEADAVGLILGVLDGLEAAHAAGVVHRDIKPRNILLDASGVPRIADFGIARAAGDGHSRFSSSLGTPAYMAPEQATDAASAGPEADLFATAKTLYRLLAGVSPRGLAFEPADSPRWAAVRPELAAFLRTCLEPQASLRPRSARAMADSLRKLVPDAVTPSGGASSGATAAVGVEPETTREATVAEGPIDFDRLQSVYRESLKQRLDALKTTQRALLAGQPVTDSLRRLAHQLHGSGASYGFNEISEAARLVELAPADEVAGHLDALLDVVRSALVAPADGETRTPADRAVVLIVEDDPSIASLLELAARGPDRRIVLASSGAALRQHLSSVQPALIVLDILLADADGRQLLVDLRNRPATATVPVMMISARVGPQTRAECFALGADEFFEKPLDLIQVKKAIASSLAARPAGATHETHPTSGRTRIRQGIVDARHRFLARGANYTVAIGLVQHSNASEGSVEAFVEAAKTLLDDLAPGAVVVQWRADAVAAVLPDFALSEAELCLNVALARNREFRNGDEVGTLAVGVVAPGQASVRDALVVAERMARLASEAGPRVVLATTCGAPDRQTVALIEDDPDSALLVSTLLTQEGLDVEAFTDGESFLAALHDSKPALVILDVGLPGMDGFQVLERLRSESAQANLPVVLLTAIGDEKHIELGFELGCDDYMPKPYSSRQLMARIRRLLRRSH